MKFGKLTLLSTVALLCVLPLPVRLAAQNSSSGIINFDIPSAGTTENSRQGTVPDSISEAGAVTGHYIDSYDVNHGFLRSPGGELITFDAPGAGRTARSGQGTFPDGMSEAGAVTGHYVDSNNVTHGFVRSPGGELVTFDAPGAGKVERSKQGTFPKSISEAGAVTGHYVDSNNVNHGFLRSSAGELITFDALGAGRGSSEQGTFPDSINKAGAITGHYIDSKNVNHGFLRMP